VRSLLARPPRNEVERITATLPHRLLCLRDGQPPGLCPCKDGTATFQPTFRFPI